MLLPGGARERVVAQESEEVEPAPPAGEEALPVVLAGTGGGLMLVLSAIAFCMRGRRRRAAAKEGEDVVVQVL